MERYPEILVAPGVTFVAVLVLLLIARFYDELPVHAPDCGFQKLFGSPCPGCGGTRSMQAFAHGRFREALSLHPAATIGVASSAIWFGVAWFRFLSRHRPLSNEAFRRRGIRGLTIGIGILFLNWIYLLFFLK